MKHQNIFVLTLLAACSLQAAAQQDSTLLTGDDFVDQVIDMGANKNFTRALSTSSASVITNDDVNRRTARNIGNSILGQGNGLVSLQNAGNYSAVNPTFYIRGLQSLSGSTPLILVDGIERDIDLVSPEEVEEVTILKDAAAVALYGYKGANGAILITTKRGIKNSSEMKFSYDHVFNFMANKPKFVDAPTYAAAINEAYANEGYGNNYRYSADELAAFQSGQYPDLYPNVDWVKETFRNTAHLNKLNAEFRGGGEKFRYYTLINLLSSKGFINNYSQPQYSYSTQDKYVQANARANFDIDLTPTTQLRTNLLGVLTENSQPGSQADLWGMVYNVPSAAFPIKTSDGLWGGNATWAGTNNPVAQSTDAAYYKTHKRSLFADITLDQDLDVVTEGLSATARMAYDTYSNIVEDHSKTYVWGQPTGVTWSGGVPTASSSFTGGSESTMGTGASTQLWRRRYHFDLGLNYDRLFAERHYLYSQLKFDYEYSDYSTGASAGINTTVYRKNLSWYTKYALDSKYIADLALVYSGSSRLAPDTKWALSPTLSLGWVLSKENFLADCSAVDFLKLRASAGIINADYLPGDNVWTYYKQAYVMDGVTYPFDSGYDSDFGRTYLGQMATANPSHEQAYKYNFGAEATLFKGLNVEFDLYYQQRRDIWVDAAGKYTSVLGLTAPYENDGKVNTWGTELSLDYTRQIGDLTLNVGGTFNWNRNEIVEQDEEPQLYDNLIKTGYPLSQLYGLKAIGLFQNQAEIDASPTQTFSTVYPGDIKYEDVNNDGQIDANDYTRIGYSTACPEIYYTFHIGGEYKGFGLNLQFQGTGRYSAMLSTNGYYWGLFGNRSLAQDVYDGRWTTSNPDAEFPRLNYNSYANNTKSSTFWMRDRSFLKLRNIEAYYNLPQSWLQPTKYIKAAKVYVRGVDLICFDHIKNADAESYGAVAPLNRSLIFGLNLTF
ncbi:MAG: SusC/RagA family TonB-linked outer membrane protein [Bacteroidaceae bacterium]|nr:SusC/RagA family TonB-linked outer membrane protein [Bacteroidaceae bacterium]